MLAIGGLDTAILKSATLCSTPTCRPLAPMTFQAAPIVRVAVEPARPHEMPALIEGLRLLNRADPFVEVSVMDTGEHVLGAAGEVHLETCIKDLQERFAKVELQVGGRGGDEMGREGMEPGSVCGRWDGWGLACCLLLVRLRW